MKKVNVLICQGEYAKNPYYIADDCCHIYCIEELCYYLYHNAFLLDDRFVTEELGKWIEKELSLEKLGKEVRRLCQRVDALSKLVTLLSKEIGYYDEKSWQELLGEIGNNNKLSIGERRKIRADSFLEAGRYALAFDEYRVILRETRVDMVALRAKVYHNMGVCMSKLFRFEEASNYFEKAYECQPNVPSYNSMLCAKKLYLKQTEYVDYLANHKEAFEDSLEVERKCELLKLEWNSQPARRFFYEISELKQHGRSYYDGIISMSEELKEEYRDAIFRNKS